MLEVISLLIMVFVYTRLLLEVLLIKAISNMFLKAENVLLNKESATKKSSSCPCNMAHGTPSYRFKKGSTRYIAGAGAKSQIPICFF